MVTPSIAARLKATRSELMITELEGTALQLFEQRGFDNVTIEDIASEAQISARTFYRYFANKEDVFQQLINRRSAGLQAALADRPSDELPMQSLRIAYVGQIATEDLTLLRQWIDVVAHTPSVVTAVLGGIQLHSQESIAAFLAARLDMPNDSVVPTMLAAATQGIIQATQTQWYVYGGDLASMISQSLEILDQGIGTDPRTWPTRNT